LKSTLAACDTEVIRSPPAPSSLTPSGRPSYFKMMPSPVRLAHRAVLQIAGPDAPDFLQNLVTAGVLDLGEGDRRYGALLSPQGKVLAEMFLEREGDAFLVDVAASARDDLLRRLTMFKLRARVRLEARPDLAVHAFAGAPDPRTPHAPPRRLASIDVAAGSDLDAYHAVRVSAGLAEQGSDFDAGEVFPADINMDLLGGVDFRKGCFVGQEVVSRMKRRGTARRRTLVFDADAREAGGTVMAGDDELGVATSAAGGRVLARVRIDRLAAADDAGQQITLDGRPVRLERPDWLDGELARLRAGA
jgi:tRNA-modifying protein YgfZ